MVAEFPPLLPNIHNEIPGGPLVSVDEGGKSIQVGVVSYNFLGTGTTVDGRPDGYARVSYFYDWIKSKICAEVPNDKIFKCKGSKASKASSKLTGYIEGMSFGSMPMSGDYSMSF